MSDRIVLLLSDFIPVAEVVSLEMDEESVGFEVEDPIGVDFEVDVDIDLQLEQPEVEEIP